MWVTKFRAGLRNCLVGNMPRASIDLGTNTCLLLIQGEDGSILHDESNVVRLGQGVADSQMLNPEAMARAHLCLRKYAQIMREYGMDPKDCLAVGTAQARDAKNAVEFFDSIQKDFGIGFRTLSGEQEAQATFLGAKLPGISSDQMVVMDIGGGSTEIVSHQVKKSLNMGAVKITEKFLKSNPVTDAEFWAAEKAIDQLLLEQIRVSDYLAGLRGEPRFIAVAGTAVTLAMLQLGTATYQQKEIDGLELTCGDLHRWVEELKWRNVEERKRMIGMESKRADVILGGALIFWRVMETFQFKKVFISTRGLRFGVFELNGLS